LTHGISFDTLVDETPENIMRIAYFDAFIRRVLGCTHYRCNESLTAILYEHERKRKMASRDSSKQNQPQTTTHKRQRLIIRHAGLKHSCMQQNTVDKKRRRSWLGSCNRGLVRPLQFNFDAGLLLSLLSKLKSTTTHKA
jgi:hypothetical protein